MSKTPLLQGFPPLLGEGRLTQQGRAADAARPVIGAPRMVGRFPCNSFPAILARGLVDASPRPRPAGRGGGRRRPFPGPAWTARLPARPGHRPPPLAAYRPQGPPAQTPARPDFWRDRGVWKTLRQPSQITTSPETAHPKSIWLTHWKRTWHASARRERPHGPAGSVHPSWMRNATTSNGWRDSARPLRKSVFGCNRRSGWWPRKAPSPGRWRVGGRPDDD